MNLSKTWTFPLKFLSSVYISVSSYYYDGRITSDFGHNNTMIESTSQLTYYSEFEDAQLSGFVIGK